MPTFVLALVLFALQPADPQNSPGESAPAASAESLIRQATFVFVGTVLRLNATTMPEVQPSESTAVVRVDEILEGPGAPPDLAGQEITVQLASRGSVKAGEQTTFFTKGWLMGNSLAVIEVGRPAGAPNPSQVREQVQATHRKAADEVLQEEISSAEAIVAGTVASVRPSSIRHIGSEHDPDWYEAEITVDSVEKGHVTGHTVVVLFPNSDDVMWQSAPKFKQGQQGVWLLHRNQAKLPGVKDQFTVLKPHDFADRAELERIRSLRKNTK
jgi:hypothetical protein